MELRLCSIQYDSSSFPHITIDSRFAFPVSTDTNVVRDKLVHLRSPSPSVLHVSCCCCCWVPLCAPWFVLALLPCIRCRLESLLRPNPTPSHHKQHRPPRPSGLVIGTRRAPGPAGACACTAAGRTQAWPAKPSTRHQPGTRRDAACGASFAQGPAAKTPKATSKPGQCMSTDNLKQDTRKCRAATRQGEDTATRKENRTVCLFQFLCL